MLTTTGNSGGDLVFIVFQMFTKCFILGGEWYSTNKATQPSCYPSHAGQNQSTGNTRQKFQ